MERKIPGACAVDTGKGIFFVKIRGLLPYQLTEMVGWIFIRNLYYSTDMDEWIKLTTAKFSDD